MNLMKKSLMSLVACLTLSAPSLALAQTVKQSRSYGFGDANFGAELTVSGYLISRSKANGVWGMVKGDVSLFGYRQEVAAACAEAFDLRHRSGARAFLRVLGYTVFEVNNSYSWTWSYGLRKTVLEKSATFYPAGVPLYVAGSVGGGFGASATLTLDNACHVEGAFEIYAYGSVSGGVGFDFGWAGLTADFTLLKQVTRPQMHASRYGIWGELTHEVEPFSVQLKIGVHIRIPWGFGVWAWDYEIPIAAYSAGRVLDTIVRS